MTVRQLLTIASLLFFLISAAYANLRAPIRIDRESSQLIATAAKARIVSEKLEFDCPEAYTGKSNYARFQDRVCQARIRYRIVSPGERLKLQFVFSGGDKVLWRIADKTTESHARSMKADAKTVCRFCPDEMKVVQLAEQTFDFPEGESELEIRYAQALTYTESGQSYFSDSKWSQGFTYELWPIAEWQWQGKVTADLILRVAARSGFLGFGYKEDSLRCILVENDKSEALALTVEKEKDGVRTASARIELKKAPQRLSCGYSAD